MTVGITGFGAYVPRLRMSRQAIVEANAWFAPQFRSRGKGHKAMANWDEDAVTMAMTAARDALGAADHREDIVELILASNTLPFAERLNAGIVTEALNLPESVAAADTSGSNCAALAGLSQALARAAQTNGPVLLAAAEVRRTQAASAQELSSGDGAAALLLGQDNVIAEFLGEASATADFVDHFRLAGEDIDYHWEERWVRDEGIAKLMPAVIERALKAANLSAGDIDHFIFPTTFSRVNQQLAARCGIPAESVADNLAQDVGDTGAAHGLLMLSAVLENARPGQIILLSQFGSGARVFVFRVTEAAAYYKPRLGFSAWLSRGDEETSYTRFLAYKGQLALEKGMRGEQDKKTALTTAWRHRRALLGFVAGRCSKTGEVHFPPSRLSYTQGAAALDTQEPYPLADRRGRVLSWSQEYLSYHRAPPHQYGQVDFHGGGRVLMEFTDVRSGEIETGQVVEMVFRIKDIDELRGYQRYFWKATPCRNGVQKDNGAK